jgi:hypothetical protein
MIVLSVNNSIIMLVRFGSLCKSPRLLSFVVISVLSSLFSSQIAVGCEETAENKVLKLYTEGYHRAWGEDTAREKVDTILDRIAIDIYREIRLIPDNCRFNAVVKRQPPESTEFGVRLSNDATIVDVLIEFKRFAEEICIGLNNVGKIGAEIDGRFPYKLKAIQPTEIFKEPYYAMKCFSGDLGYGRYLYY